MGGPGPMRRTWMVMNWPSLSTTRPKKVRPKKPRTCRAALITIMRAMTVKLFRTRTALVINPALS